MTVSDLRVLVNNLDEYIHIPGGIERLKKTVLHLAISGQLVTQDPSEGTGEELYKQIRKIHSPKKPLPDISDIPFNIPDSWKWVNLAEIVQINIGRTPSRTESKYWGNDIPWVSIADLSENNHISQTKERISANGLEKCFKGNTVPAGTLLYSFKLTIGKMSIIDMDAVHNEAIASLVTHSPITTEYLFKALKIIDPLSKTNSAVMGKTLNSQSLAVIEVPLPPLGEQQRIVDRVDEIFTLIDELDAKYKAEEAERSKLVRASMRALSHDKYTPALDGLSQTIKTKADAAELRKAILHLAVSGQLVPQDPSEGTGEELYKQIQAEKAKLPRKQKAFAEINEDEAPFVIPASWTWVRLGELFLFINGDRGKNYPSKDKLSETGDMPFFSAINLQNNTITPDRLLYLSQSQFDLLGSGKVKMNDLIVCIRGSLGKHAISNYDVGAIASSLVILRNSFTSIELNNYSSIYLDTELFSTEIKRYDNGTAQPNLSADNLKKFAFPLPPLAEQKRIVAKTTKLLGLVTELEKHLEN